MSIEDIALGHAGSRAIKVSAESNVKKVAGAICHCIRIGGVPPALLAKGINAINQAIKSIAIARSYLEDEDPKTDLVAQPSFDGQSSACVIHCRRSGRITIEHNESDQLTVTNRTNPYKCAGAIAAKIRDKERVGLSAIGPISVFHAVEALAVSRRFLKDERIDVKFTVKFNKVEVNGKGDMSAVYFACLPRKML